MIVVDVLVHDILGDSSSGIFPRLETLVSGGTGPSGALLWSLEIDSPHCLEISCSLPHGPMFSFCGRPKVKRVNSEIAVLQFKDE